MTMHLGLMAKAGGAAAMLSVALPTVAALPASASPIPPAQFTCAVLTLASCNESAQLTNLDQLPDPSLTFVVLSGNNDYNCPAIPSTDYLVLSGPVTGSEHGVADKNTQKYSFGVSGSAVTVTAYDSTTGAVDQVYTGALNASYNTSFSANSTAITTESLSFSGRSAAGTPLTLTSLDHSNINPPQMRKGNLHYVWTVTC